MFNFDPIAREENIRACFIIDLDTYCGQICEARSHGQYCDDLIDDLADLYDNATEDCRAMADIRMNRDSITF